jgi:NCAIR mutase (PurE)-related protein
LTNSRTPTSHVIATNLALGLSILFQALLGMVLRASGASAANFQQLLHSDLGAVGVNTHSQIDAHIADLAQHRLINDSGTSTIELFSASKVLALIAGVNGQLPEHLF